MNDLLVVWAGLAGFAALIAFLINILKVIGWVKDDQAQTWSAGLNILGLAGLLAAGIWFPDLDIEGLDAQVAQFVNVGMVVFTYVIQLLSSKVAHIAVRGATVIGKSFSS